MKMPILYSAIAATQVKVLRLNLEDLSQKFPHDVVSELETKCMNKLHWIKERMEALHKTRREISKLNVETAKIGKTVNHVQNIYPISSPTI